MATTTTTTTTTEPVATIWLENGTLYGTVAAWRGPLSECKVRLYAMVDQGLDVYWNAEPPTGKGAPINGYRL